MHHQIVRVLSVGFAVLASLACFAVNAQQISTERTVKHALGVSGGYIQGSGLTYMRYFGSHILQASFTADVSPSDKDIRVGLSYGRYLHRVRQPRSLVPVALKFIAGADVRYQEAYIDADVIVYEESFSTADDEAYFIHSGAGLGIDIGNPGAPGLVLSFILSYALSLEEVNNSLEWEISPLPAVSLFYNW